MEGAPLTMVVGLVSSVMTFIGVVIASRYGLLGKREETEGKRAESVPAILEQTLTRLHDVEKSEERCQQQVFQLKSDLQTTWLAIEMILLKCPEADDEVSAAIGRMKERQKAFLHREEAELTRPQG